MNLNDKSVKIAGKTYTIESICSEIMRKRKYSSINNKIKPVAGDTDLKVEKLYHKDFFTKNFMKKGGFGNCSWTWQRIRGNNGL